MLKTQIILLAVAMSWFFCTERPETDTQALDSKVADNDGEAITDDGPEEHRTPEPEPMDVNRAEGLIKLGALATLTVIVLAII